jgi:rhomboid protease GluP
MPRTFGRVAVAPAALVAEASAPRVDERVDDHATAEAEERNPIADMPLLTVGMIVCLVLVFGLEHRFAFDIDQKGNLSVESLVAFGATSRDLIFGAGGVWRLFLGPLLHASNSHLIGNCVAMFLVGARFEAMIGRGWFAAIFLVSAFGGEIGSLVGNPPNIPGVGASGAISGLIGALLIISFHHRADPLEQAGMRKTALFFGVPAIAPLFFGATGNTDYFAHLGGAIAGAGMALTICMIWADDLRLPQFAKPAAIAAALGLGFSSVSVAFAATGYQERALVAAQLIPSKNLPEFKKLTDAMTVEFLRKYPKDPMSHVMRAVWLEPRSMGAAEGALRMAVTLAEVDGIRPHTVALSRPMLAVIVAEQGRRDEALRLIQGTCGGKTPPDILKMLKKAALCA